MCIDYLSSCFIKKKQKEFEDDFITSKPNHYEYIQRLQRWRDRFEKILDARPRLQPLAVLSHYLTEFQYSKVDEIEVPGQYTEVRNLPCSLLFF
jgi:transformation/transcription domain-associated protein